MVKNLPAMQETRGSIPGQGRSSGQGNGNPLCFLPGESPWTEEPGGVTKSWTQLKHACMHVSPKKNSKQIFLMFFFFLSNRQGWRIYLFKKDHPPVFLKSLVFLLAEK